MVAAVLVVLGPQSAGAAPAEKITICHNPGNGTYTRNTVSVNSLPGAHYQNPQNHSAYDVIPGRDNPDLGLFPATEADVEKYCGDVVDATLTVTKTVSGGTAVPDDFALTVTPSGEAGIGVSSGVANTFAPGSYVVSETLVADYVAGTWGGDCAADGSITLVSDGTYSCTITNTYDPPTLTVTKTVDNTGGGTAVVGDFTLTVTPDGGSGVNVTSGASNEFASGDYTVSESSLASYSAGVWGGDCAADGTITMATGTDYSCSITNTFVPPEPGDPTLTVTKTVDNTAGGEAVVGDFTLTVTPDGGSGVNVTSGDSNTFEPGDYTVSESSLENYVAGDWGGDCAADGSIKLEADTDYECTITNTFEAVAGPEEPTTTTSSTTTTTIVAGGSLPNTGGSADLLVLFIGGLGLMLLGAGLFLMAPRRRLIA